MLSPSWQPNTVSGRHSTEHDAAWAQLFALEGISPSVLDERKRAVEHHILRDGITHNVYHDGSMAVRPWSLEILPALIPAHEWASLETGIQQRADLLQRILADFYGPQRLLQEGLLPGTLLERHTGYITGLRGHTPVLGLWLHMVAFDVVRTQDHQWLITAQRTQSPSGLGYVLHNRLLISRQFPAAYNALRVQHIASTYRQLLLTLEDAARAVAVQLDGLSTPRIALWTPGPYNETYFEHAYLARYLGLPLVEGADLTVRGDRLFLKTVRGLEPLHGILRRVDEDWCDPLELKAHSQLGVPGLLHVLRAGHLAMTNMPGVGVLESPALNGFMPAIAQALLQEPLMLPHVNTWWCGEQSALDYTLNHSRKMVLHSAFPQDGLPFQTYENFEAQRINLLDDPDAFVARETVEMMDASVWRSNGIAPQPAVMRVYAISDMRGQWHVLPGGMMRTSAQASGLLSMHRGGASVDTWVLTEGSVDRYSMLQPRLMSAQSQRRRVTIAARTAENLYWIGRYTERIEQALPLLRWSVRLASEMAQSPQLVHQACLDLCRYVGVIGWGTTIEPTTSTLFENSILKHTFDCQSVHGTYGPGFNVQALERAAQHLRERLSLDHWRLIRMALKRVQRAQQLQHQPPSHLRTEMLLKAIDQLGLLMGAITGAQTDRMTRDPGWRLLTIGRQSERLLFLCQCLRIFLGIQAYQTEQGLDALLELTDSTITFRSQHQRLEDLNTIADILIFDTTNPRSIAGVLLNLRQEIQRMPGDFTLRDSLLNLLPRVGVGVTAQALEQWMQEGGKSAAEKLADHLQDLSCELLELAHVLGQHYFMPMHQVDQIV